MLGDKNLLFFMITEPKDTGLLVVGSSLPFYPDKFVSAKEVNAPDKFVISQGSQCTKRNREEIEEREDPDSVQVVNPVCLRPVPPHPPVSLTAQLNPSFI